MLSLLGIVIVFEHLVEHEVKQLLVRNEKLDQLLPLDLRELFNLLRRSRLDDPQVGLKQVCAFVLRAAAIEAALACVHLAKLISGGVLLLLELHLDQLLAEALAMSVDALNENVGQLIDLVRFEIDLVGG